jgi:hypothetical protein
MNKKLVFKYFDMIYTGYEKHARRPIDMMPSRVLFEYMNNDGRIAFNYNTERETIVFDYDDFYGAKNMFGITVGDLVDMCKEYVTNKFNEPMLSKKMFLIRKLNF